MSHAFKSRRNTPVAESPGQDLFTDEVWDDLALELKLSPRELQIVRLVFDEFPEGAMADVLDISIHTVHTHLDRVYRKLGVRTRAGLVLRVCGEHLAGMEAVIARIGPPEGADDELAEAELQAN
jgi:DNA-binding CsgD family transcriptional regulator